ncbi:TPA: type I toxin-antitoxin system Ibs family toxin, partial [Escherichia coli]|nr:type I toxin-antitoxin system Ibs family toxin [Escherichia coli]
RLIIVVLLVISWPAY